MPPVVLLPSAGGLGLRAHPAGPAAPVTLGQCLLLALLLHLAAVLWLGNAPSGSARPGEGVGGSLNIRLQGAANPDRLAPPDLVPWREPGPPGTAPAQRSGGVVRETPATDQRPGAVQAGRWQAQAVPASPGPTAAAGRLRPVLPERKPDEPGVPDVPGVPALSPSAAAALRAPAPAPAPVPSLDAPRAAAAEPVADPALATPSAPAPGPALAAAAEPAPAPGLPLRTLAALDGPAGPMVMPLSAPVQRVQPLPLAPPLPAPTAPLAPPPTLPPSPPPSPPPEAPAAVKAHPAATAPALPTPRPALPPAAAVTDPSAAPPAQPPSSLAPGDLRPDAPRLLPVPAAGGPDAGSQTGQDLATPPSAPSDPPRLNLDLPRPRGGELSQRAVPGVLPVLPRPPEVKSKLERELEQAARPDCRTAHGGAGVLAVVPLVVDTVRGQGCRW